NGAFRSGQPIFDVRQTDHLGKSFDDWGRDARDLGKTRRDRIDRPSVAIFEAVTEGRCHSKSRVDGGASTETDKNLLEAVLDQIPQDYAGPVGVEPQRSLILLANTPKSGGRAHFKHRFRTLN